MSEIKGHCKDCHFIRQEWVIEENEFGQREQVLDKFCDMCDVFKRDDGYCDFWMPC